MQSAKVSDPIREEGETPLPPFKLESKRAIRFAPLDSTEEIPSVPSAFTQQQQQQGAVEATTTDGESPVSNLTHTSNQSSQSEASGGPTLASSASQQQLQKQQQQQLAQLPLQVKKGRFSVVEKSLSSSGSSPLEPGVPRAGSPKMDSGPVPVQQQQHQVGGSPMSANPKEDSQKGLQGLAQQQDQQQQQQQAQQQQQQPPVSTRMSFSLSLRRLSLSFQSLSLPPLRARQ